MCVCVCVQACMDTQSLGQYILYPLILVGNLLNIKCVLEAVSPLTLIARMVAL